GSRPDARHAADRRCRRTARSAAPVRAAAAPGAGAARPAPAVRDHRPPGGEALVARAGRLAAAWGRASRADLPRAAHAVFEAGELLDADRAAGVHLAGGDADLGAEAELAAVRELRRGVVQHDRGIDLAQKALGRGLIGGDDGVGVVRAVALDMVDGAVEPIDHARGDDGVEIFGGPVLFG